MRARRTAMRRRDLIWHLVAFALAVLAAVGLLVLPTVATSSASVEAGGTVSRTEGSATLLETEGASALVLVAVPVALTLIPLLVSDRRRRWTTIVCTVLLAVGVLLALMSIGVAFVPALAALIVACLRSPAARRQRVRS